MSFPIRFLIATGLLAAGLDRSAATETNSTSRGATTNTFIAPSPVFVRFVKEKRALSERITKTHELKAPWQVAAFYNAAEKGDWVTASNLFATVRSWRDDEFLGANWPPELWEPMHDVWGAFELFHGESEEFLAQFGSNVVRSIPPGSIYFGGTDHGRFAVSAFSEAHSEGRPFFTITQNALADARYLNYVKEMFGEKIYVATPQDHQTCFTEYATDAAARMTHDMQFPREPRQIRPGEEIVREGDRVSIKGQMAVMSINALLAKVIFDKNAGREFYYEESIPLDWMYPRLTPHQFIFKLNREPLAEIPATIVRADRDFWTQRTDAWLGGWLRTNTSLQEIAQFSERTFLRKDLAGFKGNAKFIHDDEARHAFAKSRCSIAGLYAWRAEHAKSDDERKRMSAEAGFAFRQALALMPEFTETVERYASFLLLNQRTADALLVAETASKLDREDENINTLVRTLRQKTEGGNRR